MSVCLCLVLVVFTVVIIKLHRSTTYVDAVYCYRLSSVVPSPPFRPLVHSLPHLLPFLTFSLFPFSFALPIFSFVRPFPFTRIVPLHFQAGGHRRRPNLGLVYCVYFVLSVLLS